MPRAKPAEIQEKDITGLKYFAQLNKLLQELREVGCERDRAGNRTLYMDQYCMLILLYLPGHVENGEERFLIEWDRSTPVRLHRSRCCEGMAAGQ